MNYGGQISLPYVGFNNNTFYQGSTLAQSLGLNSYIALSDPNLRYITQNGRTFSFLGKNFAGQESAWRSENFIRFKNPNLFGKYDYNDRVRISQPSSVETFWGRLLNQLPVDKRDDINEAFGDLLKDAGKKKDRKTFEEIVNLILNYGERALSIAQGFGLVKDPNSTNTDALNDGWTESDTVGTENGKVLEKPLPADSSGGTFLGFKTQDLLLAAGVAVVGYTALKN